MIVDAEQRRDFDLNTSGAPFVELSDKKRVERIAPGLRRAGNP